MDRARGGDRGGGRQARDLGLRNPAQSSEAIGVPQRRRRNGDGARSLDCHGLPGRRGDAGGHAASDSPRRRLWRHRDARQGHGAGMDAAARRGLTATLLALLLAFAAPVAGATEAVRVASKLDTESALLGSMIIAALEARGIATVNKLRLGPT